MPRLKRGITPGRPLRDNTTITPWPCEPGFSLSSDCVRDSAGNANKIDTKIKIYSGGTSII
jgi:hypothetical protein